MTKGGTENKELLELSYKRAKKKVLQSWPATSLLYYIMLETKFINIATHMVFPSDRASSRYTQLLIHNTVWPELFEQKHQKNTIVQISISTTADLKPFEYVLYVLFFSYSAL